MVITTARITQCAFFAPLKTLKNGLWRQFQKCLRTLYGIPQASKRLAEQSGCTLAAGDVYIARGFFHSSKGNIKMRTVFKIILVSLGLMAIHGTAAADDQLLRGQDKAMYQSIAMQGDQALLDIRASVVASIPQSVNQQMATSLSPLAVAGSMSHAKDIRADMTVTAKVIGL